MKRPRAKSVCVNEISRKRAIETDEDGDFSGSDDDETWEPPLKKKTTNSIDDVRERCSKMCDRDEDIFINSVLKNFDGIESSVYRTKLSGWTKVQKEFEKETSQNRSINSLKTKWKNVKQLARDRHRFVQEMDNNDGKGMTEKEKRVASSMLYMEIATRLAGSGRSATKNVLNLPKSTQFTEENVDPEEMPSVSISSKSNQNRVSTSPKSIPPITMPITAAVSAPEITVQRKTYHDQFVRPKKPDLSQQLKLFDENLELQNENTKLQNELLNVQLQISKRDLEIEHAKMKLVEIEHWKRNELAKVEVKKMSIMANLELKAKQRDLGLNNNNNNNNNNKN